MALPNIINEINTIKSTYLPKSGGTLTGNIAIHTSNADISLAYKNLNDVVYTKPTTRQARAFRTHDNLGNILGDIRFGHETNGEINTAIIARYTDETGAKTNAELKLTPNAGGTVGSSYLKFNGYDVITSKGGYTVNGSLNIKGSNYAGLQASNTSVTWGVGSAWNNAPSISLYSPAYTNNPGIFSIRAISSDGTTKELVGKPDGNLYWVGKHVVRIDAQSTGATGYRRYADGFRIQWGRINVNECVKTTVTLPIAFSNANYHVDVCNASGKTVGDTEGVMTVCEYTTTNFKISTGYINPNTSAAVWFACGY